MPLTRFAQLIHDNPAWVHPYHLLKQLCQNNASLPYRKSLYIRTLPTDPVTSDDYTIQLVVEPSPTRHRVTLKVPTNYIELLESALLALCSVDELRTFLQNGRDESSRPEQLLTQLAAELLFPDGKADHKADSTKGKPILADAGIHIKNVHNNLGIFSLLAMIVNQTQLVHQITDLLPQLDDAADHLRFVELPEKTKELRLDPLFLPTYPQVFKIFDLDGAQTEESRFWHDTKVKSKIFSEYRNLATHDTHWNNVIGGLSFPNPSEQQYAALKPVLDLDQSWNGDDAKILETGITTSKVFNVGDKEAGDGARAFIRYLNFLSAATPAQLRRGPHTAQFQFHDTLTNIAARLTFLQKILMDQIARCWPPGRMHMYWTASDYDCYAHSSGIFYEILTAEYVKALAKHIVRRMREIHKRSSNDKNERCVLECGARNGRLSHFLLSTVACELGVSISDRDVHSAALQAKDVGSWRFRAVDLKPRVKVPEFHVGVEQIDYRDAVERYHPAIVLSSWMPSAEDWTVELRRIGGDALKEYVLIGDLSAVGTRASWGDVRSESEIRGMNEGSTENSVSTNLQPTRPDSPRKRKNMAEEPDSKAHSKTVDDNGIETGVEIEQALGSMSLGKRKVMTDELDEKTATDGVSESEQHPYCNPSTSATSDIILNNIRIVTGWMNTERAGSPDANHTNPSDLSPTKVIKFQHSLIRQYEARQIEVLRQNTITLFYFAILGTLPHEPPEMNPDGVIKVMADRVPACVRDGFRVKYLMDVTKWQMGRTDFIATGFEKHCWTVSFSKM
ncbi:hypothetical protein BC937DRAFT_93574 [Endogone sp. FLAS-F59071]|nr:hypothetical protein BC937DRAFT_93574 [Endogone sp. FLAS-F59071]|eukprot:RUS14599.1 hypothetical protein BC937DRAFT_93574 [Endogone sp. FLAS-F59071]